MNEASIRKFLTEEFPWYSTDSSVSLLRGATTVEELRVMTIRMGRDMCLPINPDYEAAVQEYFSIYAFEEYHGEASRQKIYAEKKAKDEAVELASLRQKLAKVRIVDDGGVRRNIVTLTLPELRQAKADIENHKRMKGLSVGDLRAEYLAKHPTSERRKDGYPQMPKQMVVPAGLKIGNGISDGIHAVEMTPDFIYILGRSPANSAEFHYYRFRLVRAYGVQQVTERQSAPTGAGE